MTKIEYLILLERQLTGLPEADLIRVIDYYNEIIADRAEDMGNEEDAVAAMDPPESVAAQVLSDFSLPRLVKEKMKPRRKMALWEIVLICVGAPLWLSLLIAAFAVVISLYVVGFSLVVTLFACAVACGGIALGGILSAVCFFARGNWLCGLFYLGLMLVCIGLAIYLWYLALLLSKGLVRLSKAVILRIKRKIVKKEAQQ